MLRPSLRPCSDRPCASSRSRRPREQFTLAPPRPLALSPATHRNHQPDPWLSHRTRHHRAARPTTLAQGAARGLKLIRSLRFTKGMDALPLRYPRSPILLDWASERRWLRGNGFTPKPGQNIDKLPHRGLRDGMMRWTNGLPGAITRLGAKMVPSRPFR